MNRRSTAARVFVGGLSHRVRERDLEKFFSKVGKVTDIALKNRYAFVEFDDYRDADDAVYELNGKDLMGERVSVEKARGTPRGSDVWRGSGRPPRDYGPPPPRRRSRGRDSDRDHRNSDRYGPPTRTDYRLIVENLSSRVSWQDLKDFMRQAGEVTYADAHKQRKNEGVVEFASYNDMKTALDKLDESELNGRKIRLIEDKSRGRRSRSSSSRSRSRSRRSKSRGSAGRSKSRSHSPVQKKQRQSRSRSNSATNHKRGKRSVSESPDRRGSRSVSRERNGRDGSGDED